MFMWSAVVILSLATLGYILTRQRADRLARRDGVRLHSLPGYHGAFVALWTGIPSLILVIAWIAAQTPVIDHFIIASLPASLTDGAGSGALQLLLSQIKTVAGGQVFGEPAPAVMQAAARYAGWQQLADWAAVACGLAAALLGLTLSRRRITAAFRARQGVERIVTGLMIACAVAAILTTLGIILSLLFEALRFFEKVPWYEFFFGLSWEPQMPIREDQVAGAGAFGAVPVFAGTLLIAAIAMTVAVPIGLFIAIYLAEYAEHRFRSVAKPVVELLAGIPTVVYGFFAVLIVAPALSRFGNAIGVDVAPNSAFVAGAVMGVMIIPFISSLSDDALSSVPQSMREGSYGLGATQSETIVRVLLPAALPGIVGGVLLGVSRAIGETMIVVMAAGLIANMTANPLESVTTVTVQIVTLLIGDTEFDSPKTLAAFALGLVLFAATLVLNVIALKIVQKYRERYE